MLPYAIVFIVITLLAALLGLTGVSLAPVKILLLALPLLLISSYVVSQLRHK